MNTNAVIPGGGLWEVPQVELANARFLSEGRVGLILIALLLVFIGSDPPRSWIIAVLLLYAVYAVVQLRRLRSGSAGRLVKFAHWVDAGCYCVVIELTGGIASGLSFFLLFPVLVASSQSGLRSGIAVALACTLWLVTLGAFQTQLQSPVLDQISIGSGTFLLLVAFVIARWGHSELTLMRRLALATDLNRLFTPRHGLDHALYEFAAILCSYQRADACMLVVSDTKSSNWLLYEVQSDAGERPTRARAIGFDIAQPLLEIPPDHAVIYREHGFFARKASCSAYDAASMEPRPADAARLAELANLLGGNCVLSLPLGSQSQTIGRMHFTSQRKTYTRSDVRFLTHIMGQAALMIENLQLVERLAQEVASEERKRISRDLHDSTIQPYIGLKLGLEALRRKFAPADALGHEVDDLLKMAGDTIAELRSYVGHLKNGPQHQQQVSLLPAVRRQAQKFSEFYGIDTQVVADADVLVKAGLYEEIMHIVREGLYNVRRHTAARTATINVRASDALLSLEFANDNAGVSTRSEFCPRSIGERAGELGGCVRVEERPPGTTVVAVEIPL